MANEKNKIKELVADDEATAELELITDGDKVMNMVLFWRKDIPEGWEKLEHAPSRRIAGMLRADIGQKDAEDVQTDQSVVVGGYGASVVNNAAASKPSPQLPDSFLVGLGGNHPVLQL